MSLYLKFTYIDEVFDDRTVVFTCQCKYYSENQEIKVFGIHYLNNNKTFLRNILSALIAKLSSV